jgi:hypothetical protein
VWVTAPAAVVGFAVAWRKRGDLLGWIILVAVTFSMLTKDASYYAVDDYRLHHGGQPLGWVALLAQPGSVLGLVLLGLIFLPFPSRTMRAPDDDSSSFRPVRPRLSQRTKVRCMPSCRRHYRCL